MRTLRASLRLLCAAVILSTISSIAAAQDAGQVLRVSVGYGTLKNSVQVSTERKAEVDRIEALARKANTEGKYGEALKHLYHAMALLRGTEWTPAAALSSALTLKLDRVVLEPGKPVNARLGQMYALDDPIQGRLNGTIQLTTAENSPQVKASQPIGEVNADFTTQPLTAALTIPDVPDGNYRVVIKLESASGTSAPIVRNTLVHIEKGLADRSSTANARAKKIEAALRAKGGSSLLNQLPSVQYRLALVDLANSGDIGFDRIDFGAELKEANTLLDSLEAGNDPFSSRRGDFKKAYLSQADKTLQPYRVFVPAAYDKTKRTPLIVALHGMGGDENSYFDAYARGAFKVEAEKRGYIVVCPKGRKPASMYVGDAERDVMDVIAEARRDYNIDPDRIYLTGHSMGGYGTWSVAMDHPDLFAALAPIAGGNSNPKNISKIARVPMIVVHGDNDKTVPVERSREMVAEGKKLGAEMKYIEVPGGTHVDVVVPTFKDVFDWFDSHHKATAEEKAAGAGSKNK